MAGGGPADLALPLANHRTRTQKSAGRYEQIRLEEKSEDSGDQTWLDLPRGKLLSELKYSCNGSIVLAPCLAGVRSKYGRADLGALKSVKLCLGVDLQQLPNYNQKQEALGLSYRFRGQWS